MPAPLLAVVPVLVAVFILIAGNGLLTTLVPLRGTQEGFSPTDIGAIGSVYFSGMLIGTWVTPAIVRRAGHIRAFSALAAVAAVACLGFAIFVSPVVWMVLRGLIGFCFAGLYAIVEAWINAKADDGNRGRMLGLYNIVNFSGSASGQQLLRLDSPRSFTLFSGAAAFLMFALVPLAMTRAEAPPLPAKGRLDILGLFRTSPIGAVGILLVGFANGAFWSLAPAYVERMSLGATVVASFMTAMIVGSATGPYPIGRLSDVVDRRIVIMTVSALAMAVEIALVVAGKGPPTLLYGLAFALGLFTSVVYPLISAHANDRQAQEGAVHLSSTLLFLYCIGAVVGPSLASFLMTSFGDRMLFVHNAAIHAVLAGFVLWRMFERAAPDLRLEREEPPGTAAHHPVP
ncbi:MFS transporter [Chelatococcus sp. SYSU_G07232]|uniref:MFS transporter n=1 Tax=Chelatococcus albus TaxID=3047466 RepID=A0ABT7AMQ6_9HYPH|nr:MFS transporter [Chelatococcus sp. SYSU_G07232]MDJ1159836.1 MFS transporter [Chelatococcus sp. SYSU_G07232]